MSLIARLRNILPCVHSEPSDALVQGMAALALVKDQAVQAAQGLRRAADEHRAWVGTARQEIGERAEAERRKRSNPPTSEVRERIDTIVASIIADQRGRR